MTNALVWLRFLKNTSREASTEVAKSLLRPAALLVTVGAGQLLPGVLLLIVLAGMHGAGQEYALSTLAGCAAILGGASQKAEILLRAGYLRGIALDQYNDAP